MACHMTLIACELLKKLLIPAFEVKEERENGSKPVIFPSAAVTVSHMLMQLLFLSHHR